MFNRRSNHTILIAVVSGLCYLTLSWASALHELAHINEPGHFGYIPGTTHRHLVDTDGNSGFASHASIPCFLCLIGHSYSTIPGLVGSVAGCNPDHLTTQPSVVFLPAADRRLPFLRGPPQLSRS